MYGLEGRTGLEDFKYFDHQSVLFANGMLIVIFVKSISAFPGGSDGEESSCSADLGSIPGQGRYPGEGIGYPPQYWGELPTPLHRGAWRATVYGVAKSLTLLSEQAHTDHKSITFIFQRELFSLQWCPLSSSQLFFLLSLLPLLMGQRKAELSSRSLNHGPGKTTSAKLHQDRPYIMVFMLPFFPKLVFLKQNMVQNAHIHVN